MAGFHEYIPYESIQIILLHKKIIMLRFKTIKIWYLNKLPYKLKHSGPFRQIVPISSVGKGKKVKLIRP